MGENPLTKALAGAPNPFAPANRLFLSCALEETLSLINCFPWGRCASSHRQGVPGLIGLSICGNTSALSASAGNWVLLEGLDAAAMSKMANVACARNHGGVHQ